MKPEDISTQLISQYRAWLWRDDYRRDRALLAVLRRSLQIVVAIARDLRDGQLSLRAMSLVYTTVIAIVPLIAICFSVLKGFGLHQQLEPALLEALADLGDKRYEIVSNVMNFINNINVGVLGSLGFAILLYSVVSMMHKIERTFNFTWQINRGRNMAERLRDYLSVVFVGPLLIFLSAAISTSFSTSGVYNYFSLIPYGSALLNLLGTFLPYLMMSIGFSLLYLFLPNTSVRWFPAFVGGLVTAVIWKLMGWGFSTFVANSASSVAIYSAFASVIILMSWMYLGWLVLLIGASVAFYVQHPKSLNRDSNKKTVSAELREKLALNILYLIGRNFSQDKKPWTLEDLALELEVPETIASSVCVDLVALDYIVMSDDYFFPQRALSNILIASVLDDIRKGNADDVLISTIEQQVESYFSMRQNLINTELGALTLADLIAKRNLDTGRHEQ